MTLQAITPPPLGPRSRVGVAALSGVVDPGALERGLETLESLGWEPVRAANLERREELFAGSDAERLDGLHQLLHDDRVAAVLFARGGHGMLRLLPDLDWELLARRPRWFVGYSDLTPLLAQVVERCGWVALHGPMVAVEAASEWRPEEAASLRSALAGDWPLTVELDGVAGEWRGVAGRLAGGCLSLLTATIGTPWATRVDESILFLEDVAEPLYRLDRMLQQLRLAGALASVRGVILGRFVDSDGAEHPPERLVAAVRQAAGAEIPVAWGCSSGHCRPNLSLPLGARARVDASPALVLEGGGACVPVAYESSSAM